MSYKPVAYLAVGTDAGGRPARNALDMQHAPPAMIGSRQQRDFHHRRHACWQWELYAGPRWRVASGQVPAVGFVGGGEAAHVSQVQVHKDSI